LSYISSILGSDTMEAGAYKCSCNHSSEGKGNLSYLNNSAFSGKFYHLCNNISKLLSGMLNLSNAAI
jgi:hypothetical protein